MLQDYLSTLKRCLNQHHQTGSSNYQLETRLHQLTFEAFMLAEEVFKQRARVYDSKAMTVCRHHHSSTPLSVICVSTTWQWPLCTIDTCT